MHGPEISERYGGPPRTQYMRFRSIQMSAARDKTRRSGCILRLRDENNLRMDSMKNMILSTLVVAVIAAAAVAQSTTPEPTPQSTPAPSTSVQSTPAVTSAPQPCAAPGQDAAGQAQNA